MRRLLLAVAVLLALAGAAQATARDSAARKPVLAATASGLTYHVFAADPVSLRAVAGRRSWPSVGFSAASRSPDGAWLAVVTNNGRTLRFVRLATMRTAGSLELGRAAQPIAWLSKRLLVVSKGYGSETTVAGIDAVARRVLWERPLADGIITGEARTADSVVLVLRPLLVSGPARLVVIRANGGVRSIGLDRLLVAGLSPAEEVRTPGLAVDPAGNRAYVVDADGLVAEIDLDAMTVAYHGAPRAFAKVLADHYRQAIWLGNGMLAVTGSDSATLEVNGGLQGTTTPSGLYLVDAETGAARLLQRDAAAMKIVGRSLLAYGAGYASGAPKVTGSGLTVYGFDGTLRAHFFGTTPVTDVKAQGGLAYVSLPDRSGHVAVLDPAAGQVLRSITRASLQVLAG